MHDPKDCTGIEAKRHCRWRWWALPIPCVFAGWLGAHAARQAYPAHEIAASAIGAACGIAFILLLSLLPSDGC